MFYTNHFLLRKFFYVRFSCIILFAGQIRLFILRTHAYDLRVGLRIIVVLLCFRHEP